MVCDNIHHKHHDECTNHVVHEIAVQSILVLFSIDTHRFDIVLANHRQIQLVGHCMQSHRWLHLVTKWRIKSNEKCANSRN